MSRTTTVIAVPAALTQAVTTVHRHLAAYGHHMTWQAAGRQAQGTCGPCEGRVQIYLDGNGTARATADPAMIAPGDGDADYAECPSIPRLGRFAPRRTSR